MNGQVTQSVMLDKFAYDLKLEIVYTGRGVVTLASMSVERPGLQLAGGFFNYFDSRRVIVFGLSEYEYLRTFTSEERKEKISHLLEHGELPCIILSRDLPALPELVETAKQFSCPIFSQSENHHRPYERSLYLSQPFISAVRNRTRRTYGSIWRRDLAHR